MNPNIKNLYGGHIRVRACGLCWKNGELLMVNHRGLTSGDFWAPPGGGLVFGESVDLCLKKEFQEETGLQISVGQFCFACEFIQDPLHAIELFFEVTAVGGVLSKGDDPELPIIDEVRFMALSEIIGIHPSFRHGIFGLVPSPEGIKTLKGFFTI